MDDFTPNMCADMDRCAKSTSPSHDGATPLSMPPCRTIKSLCISRNPATPQWEPHQDARRRRIVESQFTPRLYCTIATFSRHVVAYAVVPTCVAPQDHVWKEQ